MNGNGSSGKRKRNDEEGVEQTNGKKSKISASEKKQKKIEKKEKKQLKKAKKMEKKEQNKKRKFSEAEDSTVEKSSNNSASNGLSDTEKKKLMEEFHQKESITLQGDESSKYFPIFSFNEARTLFPNQIINFMAQKFDQPTPIQSQCWPILADSRDIIGIAQTGSGKTYAFLVPTIVQLQAKLANTKQTKHNPSTLILSPTRELALQTYNVCVELAGITGIKSVCIYGGVPKHTQKQELKGNVDIVVATPGRLIDLLNEQALTLKDVNFMILDEADRMLDMGFEQDVRCIISQISKASPQTLMFSATWPVVIQKLASEFLKNPIRVTIGSEDLAACHRVTQHVEVIDEFKRDFRLLELLKQYHSSRKNRVLVFVLYKKEASRIELFLNKNGWNAKAIHGDKGQWQRTDALEQFKNGSEPLLIATDVAGRGLDIPNVEYVINYSFPLTIEDYVHRIGRTGRGGKDGIAHTLFTVRDKQRAGELVNVLYEAKQVVPESLTKFGTHVKKKEHSMYGAHFKPDSEIANRKPVKIVFD